MTIESEEFYNLCQRYRFANICNQAEVSEVYQDLINFIDAEITSLREQLEIAKKDGEPVTEKYSLSDAIQLCEDLLNPNMFGYSVTAEVRNRAREALGLKGRE